ncbi:hypothetical protein VRY54_04555 [Actinomyces sp. F1_1611]
MSALVARVSLPLSSPVPRIGVSFSALVAVVLLGLVAMTAVGVGVALNLPWLSIAAGLAVAGSMVGLVWARVLAELNR